MSRTALDEAHFPPRLRTKFGAVFEGLVATIPSPIEDAIYPCRPLGLVHRYVGVTSRLVVVLLCVATATPMLASTSCRNRRRKRGPQRLSNCPPRRSHIDTADIFEQDRELIAAEPGRGVAGPGTLADAVGHRLQHMVADRVTELVVDALEVVEVDEQHDHRVTFGSGNAERVVHAVEEQRPIGEIGELVVVRRW